MRELAVACGTAFLVTLLVGPSVGLIAVLLALILVLGFMRFCTARLGGVTGDTFGAIGELVETATFCLYAVLTAVPANVPGLPP